MDISTRRIVIKYHGLPITPGSSALKAIKGGHAFVSFAHPDQLGIAVEAAQSFALDNGAFSAWKSGNPIKDWTPYFEWVDEVSRLPGFDWCCIPDEIDGDENSNLKLMARFGEFFHTRSHIGVPIWHLHESLECLAILTNAYPRVAIGSSGEFASIGTQKWWHRMNQAMKVMCDEEGRPKTKIHGLRMLDPDIFTRFPFSSADSTNIGRNIGIDSAWRGTYTPPSKEVRAMVMRERIESHQSAQRWIPQPDQEILFAA